MHIEIGKGSPLDTICAASVRVAISSRSGPLDFENHLCAALYHQRHVTGSHHRNPAQRGEYRKPRRQLGVGGQGAGASRSHVGTSRTKSNVGVCARFPTLRQKAGETTLIILNHPWHMINEKPSFNRSRWGKPPAICQRAGRFNQGDIEAGESISMPCRSPSGARLNAAVSRPDESAPCAITWLSMPGRRHRRWSATGPDCPSSRIRASSLPS
jgi:hypothetical protein